jgi:hypothetical protein
VKILKVKQKALIKKISNAESIRHLMLVIALACVVKFYFGIASIIFLKLNPIFYG